MMTTRKRLLAIGTVALAACNPSDPAGDSDTATGADDFVLTSPAFAEGDELPEAFICEAHGGLGESPPLQWSDPPEGTQSFALTMHHFPMGTDPATDIPSHYWLLWNIDGEYRELSQGNLEGVGIQGSNKDGVEVGYTPPCSPSQDQVHVYTISVYALSGSPDGLPSSDDVSVDYEQLTTAIEDLILDSAQLSFTG